MDDVKAVMLRTLFRTKKDNDKHGQKYWNLRWAMKLRADQIEGSYFERVASEVKTILEEHDCANVLEIGCGTTVPLRSLKCATHSDFSIGALKRANLASFIFADITKHIPVPDKTFDATFSHACLMHIPDNLLPDACAELRRVTKKLIILHEGGPDRELKSYFDGLEVVMSYV